MAAKKKVKKKVAKKKASKAKGLAVLSKNTSIDNFQDRLKSMAGVDADRGHDMGESRYISTSGGIFSFGGNELPNPLIGVITDFAFENVYYEGAYNPDVVSPPVCFAVGNNPDELVADPSSPDMQGAEGGACEGCEMNEWESGQGKGKACKNGVRLAIVNAANVHGELDLSNVNALSEPSFLRLAPTSLKHFEKFKTQYCNVVGLPILTAVVEIELVPNKTWYEVHFTLLEAIEDEQTQQNMLAVHDNFEDELRKPYDVSSFEEATPARRSGKKKVAKKKVSKKKAAKKSARAPKY